MKLACWLRPILSLTFFFLQATANVAVDTLVPYAKYRNYSYSYFIVSMNYLIPYLRINVYFTKDDRPVIYKNFQLDPLDFTNLSKATRIEDLNYEELKQLVFSKSSQTLAFDTSILGLDELLDLVRDREMERLPTAPLFLNVMPKQSKNTPIPLLADELIYTLKKNFNLSVRMIFSDDKLLIKELEKRRTEIPVGVAIRSFRNISLSKPSCLGFYNVQRN